MLSEPCSGQAFLLPQPWGNPFAFHPILQALVATCFTWGLTALGAAGVFLA